VENHAALKTRTLAGLVGIQMFKKSVELLYYVGTISALAI
jgi:hypothetical protein